MKLSDVVKIWDIMSMKESKLTYNDFEVIVDGTVGIEDDIFIGLDYKPSDSVICPFCGEDLTYTPAITDRVDSRQVCSACGGKFMVGNEVTVKFLVTPIFED